MVEMQLALEVLASGLLLSILISLIACGLMLSIFTSIIVCSLRLFLELWKKEPFMAGIITGAVTFIVLAMVL